MGLNTEAKAGLVYLVLYAILFAFLLYGYATGRFKFRSRYSVILFHVTIRLASQATGLAFGVVGYSNTSLIVAYFILGGKSIFLFFFCLQGIDPPTHLRFLQQPKDTFRSSCAHTGSSSRGITTTSPRTIHGLNHASHQTHPHSRDSYAHSPFSARTAGPWPSCTIC